ncbi:MAG: ABC transporter permease [Bacteroidales bacterium]|nr:ABC transporter permease [Bacteroidales bacterium]
MKLKSIIIKSFREQLRNFWMLALTLILAPFFVFVYYLINESTQQHYEILVLNHDRGAKTHAGQFNHGAFLINLFNETIKDTLSVPVSMISAVSEEEATEIIKNKKADLLLILPEDFSEKINALSSGPDSPSPEITLLGDLTSYNYMISAVWAFEIVNRYITGAIRIKSPLTLKEESIGHSGDIDEFDLWVPGLLVISLIMLMFTASIAIVGEVENKTILRLKLSHMRTIEFLAGTSFVQILTGISALLLTLATAVAMGFSYTGSLWNLLLIGTLTSISIIAFSLLIAAFTRSANEVLVIGNFPMFLFMFFTGAAFPMKGAELFSLGGYPVTIQGIMSPTHAISALNKTFVMGMDTVDILPEIIALLILTLIYFLLGAWAFRKRHMKVE